MTARRLVLVRHSEPEMRRDVPAPRWHLTPAGLDRARAFARRLPPTDAPCVFTSVEPKALETARAIAGEWSVAVEEVPGLHEHERPEPQQILSAAAFEERMRGLFARPGELVFGAETADAARRRFTAALLRLLARSAGDVIVVTHGTVIALFVGEVTGTEPFDFWKRYRREMPFAVTLTLPELRLERAILSG